MLNKVILMGRLTKDPEMKTVGTNNIQRATFTLAVNRPKYGENEPQADFISIVAWRKTAELVGKYFTKGKQVYVVGRIQTRSWDGEDGKKRYATDVVADEVGFAESKKSNGGAPDSATPNAAAPGSPTDFDQFAGIDMDFGDNNDLPF